LGVIGLTGKHRRMDRDWLIRAVIYGPETPTEERAKGDISSSLVR